MCPVPSPSPLRHGDCIGVIAPAGQIQEKACLEQGISILREMGFEVRLPRDLWPGSGYLADADINRALEFHRMWEDPEVAALLALRGGFGCLRLFEFLEKDRLQNNSKFLVGFSDITILHGLLYQSTGMISLHGPTLTTLSSITSESLQRFYESLTGRWNTSIGCTGLEILRGGDPVQGNLLGGNLSSLVSTLGTPLEQDLNGALLFLEDVGEPLYRLDRMLTQLAYCGTLGRVAGIILGDFSPAKGLDRMEKIRFHEEIWTRVLELTRFSGIPVWGNFPVGHGRDNLTLPHGAKALMDNSKAELSFIC